MLKALVLAAIRFYRVWLSPRKGYRCAWGCMSGRDSCSGVGLRAVRRAGVWKGWWLLQRQFDRCALAAQALRCQPRASRPAGLHRQRGACDVPDLPGVDCGDACDAADCCVDAGDCGRRDRDSRCCSGDRRADAARRRTAEREQARRQRANRPLPPRGF